MTNPHGPGAVASLGDERCAILAGLDLALAPRVRLLREVGGTYGRARVDAGSVHLSGLCRVGVSPCKEHRYAGSRVIEILVVPDCANAAAARAVVDAALSDLGMGNTPVRTTVVETLAIAADRGFSGSPTILIDGRDPFAAPSVPPALACRVYATHEGLRGVPELDT